jgi:hypothetical protein
MTATPTEDQPYWGKGVFVRNVGAVQHYGHVELNLSFPVGLAEHVVVVEDQGAIPPNFWPDIKGTAVSWLRSNEAKFGGRKGLVQVCDGSWTYYEPEFGVGAFPQATLLALENASRAAGIVE